MKIPTSDRSRGFTLVELLVVIAIIAVLAAAGFAAGNAAINKARKVTAQAVCVALETSVNNFFTEYGSLPTEDTGQFDEVKTDTDTEFLRIVLGQDTDINTRGVKFLSAKEGKAKKGGLIYDSSGNTIQGLYDPWGGPYFVRMDTNYDERIEIPSGVLNGGKILNGRRVAAWSRGADGTKGTGGNTSDDVVTW